MDLTEARNQYRRALECYRCNRFRRATQLMEELSSAFPENVHIRFRLALCLAAMDRMEEAAAICEELENAFPDDRVTLLLNEIRSRQSSVLDVSVENSPGGAIAVADLWTRLVEHDARQEAEIRERLRPKKR